MDHASRVTFPQKTCSKFGIVCKEITCESHNSLGPGERYKIKNETPGLGNEVALSIAVHTMNFSANPEGLIPILLVFGAVPKIALGNVEHLSLNQ